MPISESFQSNPQSGQLTRQGDDDHEDLREAFQALVENLRLRNWSGYWNGAWFRHGSISWWKSQSTLYIYISVGHLRPSNDTAICNDATPKHLYLPPFRTLPYICASIGFHCSRIVRVTCLSSRMNIRKSKTMMWPVVHHFIVAGFVATSAATGFWAAGSWERGPEGLEMCHGKPW